MSGLDRIKPNLFILKCIFQENSSSCVIVSSNGEMERHRRVMSLTRKLLSTTKSKQRKLLYFKQELCVNHCLKKCFCLSLVETRQEFYHIYIYNHNMASEQIVYIPVLSISRVGIHTNYVLFVW